MNPCDHCAIFDKIYECCGRFPENGEQALLALSPTRRLLACIHLDDSGKCRIYDHRPLACRAHFCFQYDTPGTMGVGRKWLNAFADIHKDDDQI